MKAFWHLLMGCVVASAVLGAGAVYGATTWGKVTFIGTLPPTCQIIPPANFCVAPFTIMRFQVGVYGTCTGSSTPANRWIYVETDPQDNLEVAASQVRNAYSTLVAAKLADKPVQIDGLPACSAPGAIILKLDYNGAIALN